MSSELAARLTAQPSLYGHHAYCLSPYDLVPLYHMHSQMDGAVLPRIGSLYDKDVAISAEPPPRLMGQYFSMCDRAIIPLTEIQLHLCCATLLYYTVYLQA